MRHLTIMRAAALGVLANAGALAIALSGCKPEIVDAVELGLCATTAPPAMCPNWQSPIPIPKTSTDVGTSNDAWMRAGNRLVTRWAQDVDPRAPHPEYPRPQLVRPEWAPLNGLWDYAMVPTGSPGPTTWDGKIWCPSRCKQRSLVWASLLRRRPISSFTTARSSCRPHGRGAPSCSTSVPSTTRRRYRSTITRSDDIAAVTTVSLSTSPHCSTRMDHKTSSFRSSIQPTARCSRGGSNRIHRAASTTQPSPVFWQTVWLEPVPVAHIDSLVLVPDVDSGRLEVGLTLGGDAMGLTADVLVFENAQLDDAKLVAQANGPTDQPISVTIPNPVLWSTDSDTPQLYGLRVNLRRGDQVLDSVGSYAGLRKISVGPNAGATRLLQNDRFVFQVGVLDQGYWPDGLYTAPTDEALESDVTEMKRLGFNSVRKRVKVEPDTWYWHCDTHGLNVWQDMPSGGVPTTDADKQQFSDELLAMVDGRRNHPSIITWIVYNADWGLYDMTGQLAQQVKQRDPCAPRRLHERHRQPGEQRQRHALVPRSRGDDSTGRHETGHHQRVRGHRLALPRQP